MTFEVEMECHNTAIYPSIFQPPLPLLYSATYLNTEIA